MTHPKRIDVSLSFTGTAIPVGTLATDGKAVFFEYRRDFIERNLHLSPFMLPLRTGLQTCSETLFNGLHGIFNDSLPDGWGKLLLHRHLRQSGIDPATLGPLDELATAGSSAMGALTYQPAAASADVVGTLDLDSYAAASKQVLEGTSDDMLAELRAAAGSSAGARPKVLVTVNGDRTRIRTAPPQNDADEEWLIKFPAASDHPDAGAIEYVYALMARKAGIAMEPCHLFPSATGPGYFGTRRFDRIGSTRLHVHSLSGLIHDDHRHPSLDYSSLLAATHKLTLNPTDVKAMFRLAVFNVLAHNRDDHSKNFSFLMDMDGRWSASPAYDLTHSSGPQGYQSMSVMGEARQPTVQHLRELAASAGISTRDTNTIIACVRDALSSWSSLARHHGVTTTSINTIRQDIDNALVQVC